MGELVGGELGRVNREEVVAVLAREMALQTTFKPALFPDIQADLLKIDEVRSQPVATQVSSSLYFSTELY